MGLAAHKAQILVKQSINLGFFLYIDHENFYEGRVFGENASDVSAHLEDGIMTATIHTQEDTYHVEVRHILEWVQLKIEFNSLLNASYCTTMLLL